jgi:hypothetical protein
MNLPAIHEDAKNIYVSPLFLHLCPIDCRAPGTRKTRVISSFPIMRKGEPKLSDAERFKKHVEKLHESIVVKCHPAIFEVAQLWKELIEAIKNLGPKPPTELLQTIEGRMEEETERIRRKYSGDVQPAPNTFAVQTIFSDSALQSESDSQGITEWLHWERHRSTFKQDAEKRLAKDFDASQRVLRTASDLERLRCEKGPIQPFKGNLEHWNMFEVLWGYGLEKLSPEELAEFFDSYCPCGEPHDADALKKTRNRFRKTLAEAISTPDQSVKIE